LVQSRVYCHHRRDRTPPAKKWLKKPPRKDDVPFGIAGEQKLSYFLQQLGVFLEMSTELDYIHKIDALVKSIRGYSSSHPSIGVQMTFMRKPQEAVSKKIATFVRCAGAKIDGPLLYVEMRGKVTWDMAKGLREALVELWTNPRRAHRRAHGLALASSGRHRWFPITQPK
jgi:hypothetical protein